MAALAWRTRPAILMLAALGALGLALHAYFAPMTGVTGTSGAMLVVVSSAVIVLLGVLGLTRPRGGRLLPGLILVVALGTLLAAWLLHAFWLAAAMALVLLLAVLDLVIGNGGSR